MIVEDRTRCGAYGVLLHGFYRLVAELVALDRAGKPADAPDDEYGEQIDIRYERVPAKYSRCKPGSIIPMSPR